MAVSTKAKILSIIEDIEIIVKELLESIIYTKSASSATPCVKASENEDISQLLKLLESKDGEYQETMRIAMEQNERQKEMDVLISEVTKRDNDIKQMQRSLKEAESVLATAIYQAKQKLQSIALASQRKVSSEELIKYAHKISASNAVAAPPTWVPGDPRRPYPTEVDMRCGMLGRLTEMTAAGPSSAMSSPSFTDPNTPTRTLSHPPFTPGSAGNGGGGSLMWQPSAEVQSTLITGLSSSAAHATGSTTDGAGSGRAQNRETDSVELMSSDSSSSSSSDE